MIYHKLFQKASFTEIQKRDAPAYDYQQNVSNSRAAGHRRRFLPDGDVDDGSRAGETQDTCCR
jgi:hypothetical protein